MESTKQMTSWRAKAACRGVEPGIFYPVTEEEADDAKAICAGCTVREACLDWALRTREKDGIWGGSTERERRRMLRRRRRSA
ncbi:MAG: WhiB family transcriptional regulator [Acidimicrobiales bacterium]